MHHSRLYFLFLSLIILSCKTEIEKEPNILPIPQEITMDCGRIDLTEGIKIEVKDSLLAPLKQIIKADYYLLSQEELKTGETIFSMAIDTSFEKEAYCLEVTNEIQIKGGSYAAVSFALSSFWQSMDKKNEVPKMTINDHPDYNYRSIMLDVARAWHSPETIMEIIDLCRWYKINYLHLHLTDDSAFSFPSDSFPQLATENHSYTKEELTTLNQYAYDRGVILVPEMDVPGHSSQFINKMPELFGIAKPDNNPYTISMAKEDTYAALDVLIAELANVFTYSPYIHIGGDEAFFEGMEDDSATVAYMEANNLPNLHELFLHFLIRLNESVKKTGKQTIVWAGFGEEGDLQIPTDVIVMLWEHTYHDPQDLLEKKYPIINASFKPLYVVNNRKWEPQYIYEQWQPNRWESWSNEGDFIGEELEPNEQVWGATMCAWEQSQINQMPRLRNRVVSMSQHLWSKTNLQWETFSEKQVSTDQKLSQLVRPFKIELNGLSYPELGEGNFYEHLWFKDTLQITATTKFKTLTLQYSLTKDPLQKDWKAVTADISITENSAVYIRAINNLGQQIGRQYFQKFYHKPLQLHKKGLWKELPIDSWEKMRFEDTLWVTVSTAYDQMEIRYTTNGGALNTTSTIYEAPIPITNTAYFKAQLFDKEGKAFGSPIQETYYKVWLEESLTTGKPVTASNDHIRPNCAAPANNGRISLWEMWGDHVSTENWVKVDLEKIEHINRFKVYTFWDNWRYYQYTIEGSLDDENWIQLVDFSENEERATPQGIEHIIPTTDVRYVRINMLYNSANPGLHLVEFGAFADK